MKRNALALFSLVIFLSLTINQALSQQEELTGEELGFPIQGWILGDVASLDLENNQLMLNYIDYNTDEEKEITIGVDMDTNYENVSGLEDIKIGDVIAIDYEITLQGKTTALNISVERLKDAKQ